MASAYARDSIFGRSLRISESTARRSSHQTDRWLRGATICPGGRPVVGHRRGIGGTGLRAKRRGRTADPCDLRCVPGRRYRRLHRRRGRLFGRWRQPCVDRWFDRCSTGFVDRWFDRCSGRCRPGSLGQRTVWRPRSLLARTTSKARCMCIRGMVRYGLSRRSLRRMTGRQTTSSAVTSPSRATLFRSHIRRHPDRRGKPEVCLLEPGAGCGLPVFVERNELGAASRTCRQQWGGRRRFWHFRRHLGHNLRRGRERRQFLSGSRVFPPPVSRVRWPAATLGVSP